MQRGARAGVQLKLVRKAAGLKATELADLLGVTPETVSRWECGRSEIPRAAVYVLVELYEHPRRTR